MAIGGLNFWVAHPVRHIGLGSDTLKGKQQARIDRMMAYLICLIGCLRSCPLGWSDMSGSKTQDRPKTAPCSRSYRANYVLTSACTLSRRLYAERALYSVMRRTRTRTTLVCDVCTKVIPLTTPVSEMVYGAGDLAEEGARLTVTGRRPTLVSGGPVEAKEDRRHFWRHVGAGQARSWPRLDWRRIGRLHAFGESSALGSTRRFDEAVAWKTSELLTISGPDLRWRWTRRPLRGGPCSREPSSTR